MDLDWDSIFSEIAAASITILAGHAIKSFQDD